MEVAEAVCVKTEVGAEAEPNWLVPEVGEALVAEGQFSWKSLEAAEVEEEQHLMKGAEGVAWTTQGREEAVVVGMLDFWEVEGAASARRELLHWGSSEGAAGVLPPHEGAGEVALEVPGYDSVAPVERTPFAPP